jgi:hypothetical protein
MNNPLVQLIADGRIRTLADLKATYHKLVMQTHPDAVGSDKLIRKFIEINDHYEEAKRYLMGLASDAGLLAEPSAEPSTEEAETNHRLEFYKQLHRIERLEVPYAFRLDDNQESISSAKVLAIKALSEWSPQIVDLYTKADEEHMSIKREKPMGPYLRYALALNIRPLIHNMIAYQLTGQEVYAKQSRQNQSAIMQKIAEGGWRSLYGFLTFMIEDLKNKAAVLE